MMRVTRTLLSLCVLSQFLACSSAPPVRQPPEWGYEKNAISLHLAGDPQLNLFQKQPHSLIVCLFQLRDSSAFSQLVDEKDGLTRLLDCSRFDPSVTYSKRLVIQPGQAVVQSLDRTEGARLVGIVAGYYTLQKDGATRCYPIPLVELARESALVQKPAKLSIELYLGPREISRSGENPDPKPGQKTGRP